MDNQTAGKKFGVFVPIALVTIVAIVVVAMAMAGKENEMAGDVPATNDTADVAAGAGSTSEMVPDDVQPEPQNFTYKSGTYTAMGDYVSPGGEEQIEITLVIEDDVVVDAKAVPQATRPTSVLMQSNFTEGFAEQVLGKYLDEVRLDKVSGSSLTPKGFNDAVEKIKAQAKA